MKCTYRVDALVQFVLSVALIAGVVYSCAPARPPELLTIQARDHLRSCAVCRSRGLTPERMLGMRTPTVCVSFGPTPDPDEPAKVAKRP